MSALKTKFVVVELGSHPVLSGVQLPITFLECFNHRDMVPKGCRAISAGFCAWNGREWQTYGESDSLQLQPRPEDGRLLTQFCGFE